MRVKFLCKDCGQSYLAPSQMAGKTFACRRCGWPTRVPGHAAKKAHQITPTGGTTRPALPAAGLD